MNAVPVVDNARVRAWIVAGCCHLALVLVTGFLFSTQFLGRYPFGDIEWLSPGRLRAVHTSAVAYGFLGGFLLGLWEYVIPRLTARPVWNQRLGWASFFGWQATVVIGYVALLAGGMQAIEWGEFPWYVDILVVVSFLSIAINFLHPVLLDRSRTQYVSIWYFTAAMIWTALNYLIGNFIPQYLAPGAAGAAISSMYIHDLVGLLVTPLGWGLMYYMVPVALGKPMWSHKLSLVGFWMLAFFYPLNSAHHYLWSPIPMWVQHAAIVSSVGVHLVIYTVAWNFIATAWGSGGKVWGELPVRYFYTGIAFYGLTCIQCAIQVQLPVQGIIHFTDWVVGHAHFIMFGAFGLWSLGFSQMIWPKLVGADRMWSRSFSEAHWWLSTLGMFLMWVDLTIGGVVEGFHWRTLDLFTGSIRAAMPFWLFRSLAGVTIGLGQVLFFWNLFMTWRVGAAAQAARAAAPPLAAPGPMPEPTALPASPSSPDASPVPAAAPAVAAAAPVEKRRFSFENARFVIVGAGVVLFLVAFVSLGLVPFVTKGHMRVNVIEPEVVPADFARYYKTPAEYKAALLRGRDIYIADNCWNCHTQYVRPTSNEVERYGPAATADEYLNDMNLPQLFGTRRVGPDLSREKGKHSNDWHFAHLYDPRVVVPESVMPRHPWFFDAPEKPGSAPRPTERAVALVAYLQWLGTESERIEAHKAKEVSR